MFKDAVSDFCETLLDVQIALSTKHSCGQSVAVGGVYTHDGGGERVRRGRLKKERHGHLG